NMIGKEADAQKLAETIDLARTQNKRAFPATKMWSDGYIQLAYNDGVLTAQEYNDALKTNQLQLGKTSFHRNATATRQEVATYMAKILGITPINAQTHIFNSFRDWSQSDPHKVPYMEAMLQNRIMNGDGNGYFRPTSKITRAEMAQIIANAEAFLFNKMGLKKYKGTVESVTTNKDLSNGANTETTVIDIRNSGGDLHELTALKDNANLTKNELTKKMEPTVTSSVVNRNNSLSLATSLKPGDQIYYIVDANAEVPYIQVINTNTIPRYYLGKLATVDTAKKTADFMPYEELPFADLKLVDPQTLQNLNGSSTSRYSISKAVRVYAEDGQPLSLTNVQAGEEYIVTVRNGVIEAFDKARSDLMQEKGLVSGIVKENNPSMGYITLYFEDGSGEDPATYDQLVATRNYAYGYEIPVLRDGKTVSAENILPGDQVFIKLDDDGYIEKMSAKSYYKPVYGTVHIKSPASMVVKKEDGSFVTYPLTNTTPVFKNGKPGALSDIVPGDKVRLLVQTSSDFMDIAGVDIEKTAKPVTGIYRGSIESYDSLNDSLVLSGVQEFVNGQWENTPTIGVQSFSYMSDYKARPGQRASGTAYIALKKAPDGLDRIAMAAYRGAPQYETTVSDDLVNLSAENQQMELQNTSDTVLFDQDTLAVKDGRLVDLSALDTLDPVKVAMEKSLAGSSYRANVVVSDSLAQNGPVVYRGRIQSVDPTKSVTVESFAQLNGVTWSFTNTPKTFDIHLATTRLVEQGGVGSMRNFDASYVGQSVYIVADGTRIKLISTAPYADAAASGRIKSLIGGTQDSQGNVLTGPTGLKLTQAMVYDTTNHQWNANNDMDIVIPANALVLKNGQVGTTGLLKAGDTVRIIRNSQSQDGIIILCN
ncbi:MAG: S-layer homology domain-containing protein, partial [Clostridia bacterium]|nr:S-layer homology domain-containing protein [Clostridia bacterium]